MYVGKEPIAKLSYLRASRMGIHVHTHMHTYIHTYIQVST